MTTISDLFSYKGPGASTDIRRIPAIRRTFPAAYAMILMACSKKQARLLRLLWQDRFPCLDRLDAALKKLCDEGKLPDLLDISSKNAAFLIEQEYQNA
jgi:hypothetical protein